jgi:hypothetical protein
MKLKTAAIAFFCLTAAWSASAMKMTVKLKDNTTIVRELSVVKNLSFSGPGIGVVQSTVSETPRVGIIRTGQHAQLKLCGKGGTPFTLSVYDVSGRKLFFKSGSLSTSGTMPVVLPNLARRFAIVRYTTSGTTITDFLPFIQ